MTQPEANVTWHYAYGEADFDKSMNALLYTHKAYDCNIPCKLCYVTTNKEIYGYDVSEASFKGFYNGYDNPQSLLKDRLSSTGINFDGGYVGAFQYRMHLNANDCWQTVITCGVCEDEKECFELCKLCTLDNFNKELQEQKQENDAYINVFELSTPDEILNAQANIWLKRQLAYGKTWGRGGGKGFRDVMQDITAFCSFDPSLAKTRILYALLHQYEDGNPIRMFEPDFLYPYNDGAVWIPSAILSYLGETGDLGILDQEISYIKGTSKEKSVYDDNAFIYRAYDGTDYNTTVFEHLKRAMDYITSCVGERGLVLFLGGDWNDSLNAVGKLGKGESVWLSIATVKALNEFDEICRLYGKEELCEYYQNKKQELIENIKKFGYDTDHYLYGINDYGEKIGSDESVYAKIFLNPQTWAVLANLDTKENLNALMDVVEKRLSCDFGYLQCTPSYKNGSDKIGRMSYFKEGCYENGSVYNHGVAFKVVADCLLGRGDNAYQTLLKIRFDNTLNPNSVVEPYAVTNMYFGPENKYRKGYSPNSWITGTAGWLYRAIAEYVCGIVPTLNGLKIKPCFPKHFNEINATRVFRGGKYSIQYIRSNKNQIVVDGKEIEGCLLPVMKKDCSVKVYYCD
jgi:cellobiose phosphorylase